MAKKTKNQSIPSQEQMKQDAEQAKQDLNLEVTPTSQTEEEAKLNLEELREQYRIFQEAKKQYEDEQKKLEKETTEYQQQEEHLTQRQTELNKQAETLKLKENKIQELSNQLREKERELEQKELNAKAGFIQEREQIFASLQEQKATLQEQLNDYYRTVTEEEEKLLKQREERRREIENQLQEERLKLEAEREQIQQEKQEIIRNKNEAIESVLASLQEQKATLQEQLNDYYRTVTKEEEKLLKQREERRREIENQLQEERLKLEAEREQLEQEKRELRRSHNRLKSEQELLKEDQETLEEKVEQKAATKVRELEAKLNFREKQLQQERSLSKKLESALAKKTEQERQFGQKTPEEILGELEDLRTVNAQLEEQLAARPNLETTERLQQLEKQKEAWENERFNLSTRIQELEQSNTSNRIAVTKLENLREEKEALEVRNRYLKQNLDDLKAEIGQTIEEAKEKTPFPLCFNLDRDRNLQGTLTLTDSISNLEQFTEDLRYRIARSPDQKEKYLYYSLKEIRLFLAGLAMSRLHLLQGISGTGKTSLAVGFSKAVQGGQKLVEVQAGWRDKQDLLGYFNAFEKRFYESDFLQALYEAQCPAYQDRIYIIILDEMNLSRPEQYFADFLSKLEQEHPKLKLDTDLNRPSPQLFIDGNQLKVPDNVWFIGTANQDETTLEFADKTYDRAHIMDLERRHEPFQLPDQIDSQYPISYQALTQAFTRAQNNYQAKVQDAKEFLNITLQELLERRFRIGWGNRLESQMERFIPVVLAAGGSLGEAVDHILATKILRKVRDRYDIPVTDFRDLKETLNTEWSAIDQRSKPITSLDLINREIHRLEPGEE
ncbi:hypothetical protein PCC7418_0028 [Halothece sp. PCC 7418]|uniref:hypothetical protein n=1 Tax=Halothece sp. (strain PCC 7418) TaxID=65093 RepID=UPI0002A07CDF|nr:hypothetical protein [Halothece sp. PCC 7418]AFZ42286.1 hypothetical protein PCC7418_0028 [Halothece sp. PCC 7418]